MIDFHEKVFMSWSTFDEGLTFGDRSKFGEGSNFGDNTKFGSDCKFGTRSTFGNWSKFGKRMTAEGVRVIKLMTLSNVDGSGRQIQIFIHTGGILIRAGCFKGTLDEFCTKADSEGKKYYSAVVRASAEAFERVVKETGETGGW